MTQFKAFSGRFSMKPPCFNSFFKFSGPTQVPMRGVGPIRSLKIPNIWKVMLN
jgi:hypothetical protein